MCPGSTLGGTTIMGYVSVKKARKNRKKLLVEYLGGKCIRCGYNKCLEALDFHHKNPEEKDFSLSSKWNNFKRCIEEVKKCILVCSNCHRELHNNIWNINDVVIEIPNEQVIIDYLKKEFFHTKVCKHCSEVFKTKRKLRQYCSKKCKQTSRVRDAKLYKQPEDVKKLIEQVSTLGFVKTAAIYGVSDNAVRKWFKKFGLPQAKQEIKNIHG